MAYVFNRSPNDCWEWLGGVSYDGYGRFKLNGKMAYAHRIAYYLEYGIDPGNLLVCHRCDTPECCNPKHLFLGTQSDNMYDCSEKDRLNKNRHGEKNGRVKLTKKNVIEIKRLLYLGLMQTLIAEMFGVAPSTISSIKNKRNWSTI